MTTITTQAAATPTGAKVDRSTGPKAPRQKSGFYRWALRIGVMLFAALMWETVARVADSLFFPPLSAVLVHGQETMLSGPASQLFFTNEFLDMLTVSLERLIPSLVISILSALVIGVAIGMNQTVSDYLWPLLNFIRAIPSTALVPLFIILFGIGNTMIIWLIVITIAIPLVINVIDGVRSTEPLLLDMADSFRVRPLDRLFLIVLPAASPRIFAGLRITTMLALVMLVIAEMMASSSGVGFHVLYSQRQFDILDMWFGVLILALLGYLLSLLLDAAENKVLRWHKNSHAQ